MNLDDFDYFEPCWNCGGEGFVANCQDEGACLYPEDGCDYCTRRCEYCNPLRRDSDGTATAAANGDLPVKRHD